MCNMCTYIYIYIYTHISYYYGNSVIRSFQYYYDTPNPPTNIIVGFGGLDSSIILV